MSILVRKIQGGGVIMKTTPKKSQSVLPNASKSQRLCPECKSLLVNQKIKEMRAQFDRLENKYGRIPPMIKKAAVGQDQFNLGGGSGYDNIPVPASGTIKGQWYQVNPSNGKSYAIIRDSKNETYIRPEGEMRPMKPHRIIFNTETGDDKIPMEEYKSILTGKPDYHKLLKQYGYDGYDPNEQPKGENNGNIPLWK